MAADASCLAALASPDAGPGMLAAFRHSVGRVQRRRLAHTQSGVGHDEYQGEVALPDGGAGVATANRASSCSSVRVSWARLV
jgi:hypothetical protein